MIFVIAVFSLILSNKYIRSRHTSAYKFTTFRLKLFSISCFIHFF